MSARWPSVSYRDWSATCDTVHAHAQVLGKLAAALAPPEPDWQHLALRLTARGWETPALRSPDGSGAFVVALDLRGHQTVVEHSGGSGGRVPLTPDRAVGEVTREVLRAVQDVAGEVEIDPTPQEVSWSVPLDDDDQHARYDEGEVARYLQAAGQAALVLAAFRAAYRGRSTHVNAWWGSFDVAVSLFSEASSEFAVGWWPGDQRYGSAAFYAYAKPAPDGFEDAQLSPATARWDATLGEYLLDWEDVRAQDDPHGVALEFVRSAFARAWS